jgi:spore germination cell wall hydrolase CwlJ-like protein
MLGYEILAVYGTEDDFEPVAVIEIVEEEPPEITQEVINEEELELLAHLLVGEAGSDWCSDEMIYYVGSVALNRVASKHFPDTLEEVIFAKGQYACTWDGNFNREPSERHYKIAEDLLLNGSILPPDVVYQAEFKQGSGVYKKVQNMYFCHL